MNPLQQLASCLPHHQRVSPFGQQQHLSFFSGLPFQEYISQLLTETYTHIYRVSRRYTYTYNTHRYSHTMTTLGTEDTVLSTYIAAHKLDAILAAPGIAGTAAADNKESIPCDQCAPLVATLETQLRTAAELGQVLLARHSAQAAAAQHAARRHADAETALKEMELARVRAENDCDTAERAQKAALGRVHRLEREMELMVAQYERLERTTETMNDNSDCTDFTRTDSHVAAILPKAHSTKLVDSLVSENSNLQATIIDLREQLLAARDEINALRNECDAISRTKEVHHHHHHLHFNGDSDSQLPAGMPPGGSQFHLNKSRKVLRKFVSQESGLNTTTTIFEQDEGEAPKQFLIDSPEPVLSPAIDDDSDEEDIPYSPFPILKRSTSYDSIFSTLTTHDSDISMPTQLAYPASMYTLARPALINRQTSTATVSTAGREVSAELTRSTGLNRQKSRMILHQHHYNTTNTSGGSKTKVEPSPKRSTSMGSMWSAMLFRNKTSAPVVSKPAPKAVPPPSASVDMLTPPTVAGLRRTTLPIASPNFIYPQTTFSSPSTAALHLPRRSRTSVGRNPLT